MPTGKHKSRSMRRVFKKTPGGKTKLTYLKRKPKKTLCASCKTVLKGVVRANNTEIRHMPKTKKRPQRPYGGVLCSKCSREKHKEMARK